MPVYKVDRFVFPTLNNAMIPAEGQNNKEQAWATAIDNILLKTVFTVRNPIRISHLFLFLGLY